MNNLYGMQLIEPTELERVKQEIKNFEIAEEFSNCEQEKEAYNKKIHDLRLDIVVLEIEEKHRGEQNV